jgi:hypothetical protein
LRAAPNVPKAQAAGTPGNHGSGYFGSLDHWWKAVNF